MEWISDWYDDTYYEYSPTNNPQGPEQSTGASAPRGSSFALRAPIEFGNRVYMRNIILDPYGRLSASSMDLGFRCAR